MRSAAIVTALILAGCSPGAPKTEPAPAKAEEAAPSDAAAPEQVSAKEVSVGPKSAALAYMVATYNPFLSEDQRLAISQDFNGAPLSTPPTTHTVTAESVSCRARIDGGGEGTACSIDYGAETKDLAGDDANFLNNALTYVGVEPESGMGHLERAIRNLSCTIDDKVAQETSSTGDDINGFACRFTTDF